MEKNNENPHNLSQYCKLIRTEKNCIKTTEPHDSKNKCTNSRETNICDYLKSQPVPEWIKTSKYTLDIQQMQNRVNQDLQPVVEKDESSLMVCLNKTRCVTKDIKTNISQSFEFTSKSHKNCDCLRSQPNSEWTQKTCGQTNISQNPSRKISKPTDEKDVSCLTQGRTDCCLKQNERHQKVAKQDNCTRKTTSGKI